MVMTKLVGCTGHLLYTCRGEGPMFDDDVGDAVMEIGDAGDSKQCNR